MGRRAIGQSVTLIAAYLVNTMVLTYPRGPSYMWLQTRESEDRVSHIFLQVDNDTGTGLALSCSKKGLVAFLI